MTLTASCSDIGECLIGTHNCSQVCVELDGGYECHCFDGYKLSDDGVTCAGVANNIIIANIYNFLIYYK